MHLKNIAVLFFLLSSSLSALTIGEALNENPPRIARLKLAIKCDKNPAFINEDGESYLHIAAKRDLPLSIELLMQIPEVSALYLNHNNLWQTAIEVAIIKNNRRAFNELVKSLHLFDDFRIEDEHNGSLLHLAAKLNRAWMIKPLLKELVPVNLEDDRGWSALDVARHAGSKKSEDVLVDNEAVSTRQDDSESMATDSSTQDDEANAGENENHAEGEKEVDDCCTHSADGEASDVGCSANKVLFSLCAATGACAFAAICHGVT